MISIANISSSSSSSSFPFSSSSSSFQRALTRCPRQLKPLLSASWLHSLRRRARASVVKLCSMMMPQCARTVSPGRVRSTRRRWCSLLLSRASSPGCGRSVSDARAVCMKMCCVQGMLGCGDTFISEHVTHTHTHTHTHTRTHTRAHTHTHMHTHISSVHVEVS